MQACGFLQHSVMIISCISFLIKFVSYYVSFTWASYWALPRKGGYAYVFIVIKAMLGLCEVRIASWHHSDVQDGQGPPTAYKRPGVPLWDCFSLLLSLDYSHELKALAFLLTSLLVYNNISSWMNQNTIHYFLLVGIPNTALSICYSPKCG